MSSNQRLARNTMMLYVRMLLSLIVTLYTSRIVLNTLGINDFGIYNVVGGIVVSLGFLNNAMAVSTQRFLAIEIGKKDFSELKRVLDTCCSIHIVLAIIILIAGETIGYWFLNEYLVINSERLSAANWVYQFSLFSFVITVLSVPYNALIIANEKMQIYAYVGILEVLLKLGVVYLLYSIHDDKLIVYALLLFVVTLLVRLIYAFYCRSTFAEARRVTFVFDKNLFRSIGSFAGWNLLGVGAGIGYIHGVNILLNLFFGPVVNAARGIAFQVQGAVSSFVSNFQVAVDPMITKLYAKGEYTSSFNLVFTSSKFSFFLLLILSLPIVIETKVVLTWWLKIVPENTVIFTRLILLDILIASLSGSLHMLAQASGKIKVYQIFVSGILLLNLPASYLFLKLGFLPHWTLLISMFFSSIALFARLIILRNLVNFPIWTYLKVVVVKVIVTTAISLILPITFIINKVDSNWNFFIVSILCAMSIIISIILFGLSSSERNLAKAALFSFYQRFRK